MVAIALWPATVVALLVALLDMPYGYYQLLRVGVFCVGIYFALAEYKAGGQPWMWAFVATALIYNPIAKLALGREIWSIVNIATIALLVMHFVVRRSAVGSNIPETQK